MIDLRELQIQRTKLIKQARDILDRADAEKRAMTAEENQQWDSLYAEADQIKARIEQEERQIAAEREAAQRSREPNRPDPNAPPGAAGERTLPQGSEEYRREFREYLVSGVVGQTMRDLQVDIDSQGGYLLGPQQFVSELLKVADNITWVRGLATKHTVAKASSLGVPTLQANPSDADWTSELATGNADATMQFGKRELAAHPLAKQIKISNRLLRVGMLDPEAIVRDRLAYVFGITLEQAYLSGDGNQQPLGLFTASTDGISTARDVQCASQTAIAADDLITTKFSLLPQYLPRARWLFHRTTLEQIRKLKDNYGQYLMGPLSQVGDNTVLGLPFMSSEYAPNTYTAGQYIGLLGDFSTYWILDALDMSVQRLVELYAATNQTGFIGRYEGDGMPTIEQAFARVQLHP